MSSGILIGHYIPIDSPIHRLDGRARLIVATLILLVLTFTPQPKGLVFGFIFVLLIFFLARVPFLPALRGILPSLPFLVLLAAFQIWLKPGGLLLWQWGPFAITMHGLLAGGILLTRFTTLILWMGLVSFVLSTSDVTHSLDILLRPLTRAGFPAQDFVIAIQVMLNFLPYLEETYERIGKAQASRGAEWDDRSSFWRNLNWLRRLQQMLPMIVPLFLISLRRAEQLAIAMEARAFCSGAQRTSLHVSHFGLSDGLALFAAGMVALIVIFL